MERAGPGRPGRARAATGRWDGGAGANAARDALEGARTAIAAAGCETPRLDAEVLLAHVLGVTRERLLTDGELTVQGAAVREFQDAVRRRAVQREPVAYIIGRRGFRNLELAADRRALVPRPETELLVEVALDLPEGARVLDLCTGGGAVALAVKDERPDLELAGSDISPDALDLARENARSLGLEVLWLQADLLGGIVGEYEAVLCNPPYVAEGERGALAPELGHEPPQALFAGRDGLAVIRELLAQLAGRSDPDLLALEVGIGQAAAVEKLVRGAGFPVVRRLRDLAGIERVVVGERRG
jgi:release factor glutamine methyltransferase